MFGIVCGVSTTLVGTALVLVSSIVGFAVVPGIIENMIVGEVTLINDTIQLERFQQVPFPLNFTVRVWSVSNVETVMAGGIPIMNEVGPYWYKVHQRRIIEAMDDDTMSYRIQMHFEFDAELSSPLTEDDMVTVVNVPYNAILQVAETLFPNLMPALNAGVNGVFAQNNSPFMEVRVRDLLFDGIRICDSPGLIGAIACTQVRSLSEDAQNLAEQEDGSLLFSLIDYRNNTLSPLYVTKRGLEDHQNLAQIVTFNDHPHLFHWADGDEGRGSGLCNMINGTDSAIFAPFIDREQSLYAINTDICRSVELRYQYDTEYEGIPAARFSINEWFLDNHEGCFCLNTTAGITRPNGCLLEGALELYSCVGAFLVLTYPHFLYADNAYRNGVIGMRPNEAEHRIFLDIEPNTGTVIRGMKRAQFNIFLRPIQGIPATSNLTTSLVPIIWVEEGMSLPDEFADELRTRLLLPLTLVDILLPILIAICCVVFLLGIFIIIRARKRTNSPLLTSVPPTTVFPTTRN